MSRSCKHTPRCGEPKGKNAKRIANRKVRRTKHGEIPPFGGYKKVYEQWNICDFEIVGLSFDRYCQDSFFWGAGAPRKSIYGLAELKKQYDKFYIRK